MPVSFKWRNERTKEEEEDGEQEEEKDTMIQPRDRPELAHQNIYTTGASQGQGPGQCQWQRQATSRWK